MLMILSTLSCDAFIQLGINFISEVFNILKKLCKLIVVHTEIITSIKKHGV